MLRDTSFEQFEVFPITGALGAEVRGIDLAAKPDDASFEDLRRALHQYGVLAVRDQHLPPPAFHAVARRFGPFSGNPVHTPIDGYEDVVRFVREPDDTGKVIGEEWHMDLAWMVKPPGITLLFGEVIPPLGGDTCFASLENTYRSLTPRMQELLAGLTGIHSGKGVVAVNAVHKHLGIRQDATRVDDIETEHPVVCVHPVTGRRYVFISGVLNRFKGMSEEESKPIIDFLIARAIRPENTCRVRWEQGTLTLWANPFVMHTAINDYASYRRVTYRSTVEGWVPRAASAEAPVDRAA
ncbi:MAG TPA: TauD/TfdA family dioxygenase [Acetobacteraceae bacterium]|jgi:alpha-ketoglutarate-dependent taurine dioxygenase|nr:TauD/TfdA family dioxygenase [Acetobacteraceae bacterium]